MRVLLLAGSSGISGDMLVGALCDLGVPPSTFEWELGKLGDAAGDFHLHFERGQRGGVEGVKFTVHTGAVHTHDQDEPHGKPEEPGEHAHAHDEHGHCVHDHDHGHDHGEHAHGRSYADLRAIIEGADLSDFVKQHAAGALARIAGAQAEVRGVAPEQIFFNDEDALDTLADLVCVCAGVEALGIKRVFVEQLTDGTAPSATARAILRADGAPAPREIFEPHELITPTGAALAAQLALATGGSLTELPPVRQLRLEKIGQGLGTHDPSYRANALQAVLATLISP